jgi:Flp pilus assembly protein TadD
LQYGIERCEEAEVAYRKAIELDTKDAHTWRNLGNLLQYGLERYEEAEAAYRKAIELDPNLAYLWTYLAILLSGNLNRYQEAEAAYRQAIELEPDNNLWNEFGVLLQYHLCKFQEAEQAYLKALELNPENDNPLPHGNLAFLFWLDLKRPDAAKHHTDLAGKGLDECGKQLLEVARLLAEDSLGLAWSAFDSALTLGGDALWDGYGSCLKYILRYVHHHGYGAKIQSWMEAADYPARYAPLYWAFWALREGEAILLNVNPEVRRTAEKIYQGLAIGKQSESPAQKPQRRRSTLKRTL